MKNSKYIKSAYLDFYNSNNILPVSQDLSNLNFFISRRNYLYRTLGIPLNFIKDREVLEVGPGGGFNAVATSYYSPNEYSFIDGSLKGIKDLKIRNKKKLFNAKKVKIIYSNFFDYTSSKKYDILIAEGIFPGQRNPQYLLKKSGNFLKKNGILITTTNSGESMLSEICRKILSIKLFENCKTLEEKVTVSSNFFFSHLKSLNVQTRPIKDWVLDNIVNIIEDGDYLFDLKKVVKILNNKFEFYNSSPSFFTDDRWYKEVDISKYNFNSRVLFQYQKISPYFIDKRVRFGALFNLDISKQISKLCIKQFHIGNKILIKKDYKYMNEFNINLKKIKLLLPENFKITKIAIDDFLKSFKSFYAKPNCNQFKIFKNWWGRGTQYVSLIKK